MIVQKIQLVLLYMLLAGTTWGVDAAGVYCGIINEVSGEVKIDKTGDGSFVQAEVEDLIYFMTIIDTGKDGSLSIILDNKIIIIAPGSILSGEDIYYEFSYPWLRKITKTAYDITIEILQLVFPQEKVASGSSAQMSSDFSIFPDETVEPSGTRDFDADPDIYDNIIWVDYDDELDEEDLDEDEMKVEEGVREKDEKEKSGDEIVDAMTAAVQNAPWYKNIVYRNYNEALRQMNDLTEFPVPWSDIMLLKGYCHFQMNRYIDAVSYYSYVMEHIDADEIDWEKKSKFYMSILCQKSVSDFITGEVAQSIRTMKIVLENSGNSSFGNYAREFLRIMYTREGM
jgi:hypothetical protein